MVSVAVLLLSVVAVGLYVSHQQQLEAQRLAEEEEERLQRELEAAAEIERQKEISNQQPISRVYRIIVAMYALSLVASIGVLVHVFLVVWYEIYPESVPGALFALLIGFFTFQTLLFLIVVAVEWLMDKVITAARPSTGAKKWVLKPIGFVLNLFMILFAFFLYPIVRLSAYLGGDRAESTYTDYITFRLADHNY